MTNLLRSSENPLLLGENHNSWEANGAFNGCPAKHAGGLHFVYRAISTPILHHGNIMEVSTVGYAHSKEGVHFKDKRQLVVPEFDWEKFGCEDPRVTKLGDKYYIFYTALSNYPFSAEGISIGLAITKDFKKIDKKLHITPFNSKAMALFPQMIKGKYWAILTANTDLPPAKVCLASFEQEKQIWSKQYWDQWYSRLDDHVLPLQRMPDDHVEVGAPPIKTKQGWLVIYSYIKDYLNQRRTFGIEAVLLDLDNPSKIIGQTQYPLMVPEEEYEIYGKVPNIIFPSGVLLNKNKLSIYYGGADTYCCVATCKLDSLLEELLNGKKTKSLCQRISSQPVLKPIAKNDWEAKAVFNPGAIQAGGKVHIFYRAMSHDDTSVLGYAASKDGATICERLSQPAYLPREEFEVKKAPGNSGCEDPRLTRIGSKIFMCYTALNGQNSPRVAITSIKLPDFLAKKWNWSTPKLISPPGVDDKDACIMPEKFKGKYVIIHRLQHSIDVSYFDNLLFSKGELLQERPILFPRKGMWDNLKVGINTVPLKTPKGWLFIYHGVCELTHVYKLGAALLDLKDPEKVLARTRLPIFEPQKKYEKEGIVPNVVFPCGAAKLGSKLYIYYGAADTVANVAVLEISKLLSMMS